MASGLDVGKNASVSPAVLARFISRIAPTLLIRRIQFSILACLSNALSSLHLSTFECRLLRSLTSDRFLLS